MIHIIDKQSDEIVGIIPPNEFWDDNYHRSLETTAETFEFTTFADRDYSEYLTGRNKVIIPDEDNGFRELTIWQAEKIHEHSKHIVVFTKASYNDLRKAQVIKPQTLKSQSASTAAATVLRKTEWIVGLVEGKGSRTIHVEKHTDPYSMLKRIATEFDLELNFRVETKGNKITGRYVDLVQQIGQWRGREIEFGKDLLQTY
ncbi:phage tail spike protein, partial [Virgibacillus pantothenticus]